LFREDFSDLSMWEPFYFPKIKKHSVYTIVGEDNRHYLKAESDGSASAIVYRTTFNVYKYPKARWRWKVDNVYAKGDARKKSGDDYPIRVYVMFEYDPGKAGAFERMKYGIAKSLYGAYPPDSSLSYVWASKEETDRIIESPYTDRAKMVLLEQGTANMGAWRDEEIDMVKDYEKAFGMKPPRRARIAIMNDSDNTGERSVSYLEFIEVLR
ncbi:MAG TPA: DUF3047 domain-containing protein, partial [Nitrospirota bacterium]